MEQKQGHVVGHCLIIHITAAHPFRLQANGLALSQAPRAPGECRGTWVSKIKTQNSPSSLGWYIAPEVAANMGALRKQNMDTYRQVGY